MILYWGLLHGHCCTTQDVQALLRYFAELRGAIYTRLACLGAAASPVADSWFAERSVETVIAAAGLKSVQARLQAQVSAPATPAELCS